MLATTGHLMRLIQGEPSLPAAPLLLDSYPGAEAAYGMRRLSLAYSGPILRVRRDSDNAEIDIGYTANGLNIGDLLAFVGSNSAYVSTWYDQSGHNYHAVQADNTKQPQLVNAGTLITSVNGQPAISFDGNDDYLDASSITDTAEYYIAAVAEVGTNAVTERLISRRANVPDSTFTNYIFSLDTARRLQLISIDENDSIKAATGATVMATGSLNIGEATKIGTAMRVYHNGTLDGSRFSVNPPDTTSTERTFIGADGFNEDNHFTGKLQELLVYNQEMDSSRANIFANINQYYQVI